MGNSRGESMTSLKIFCDFDGTITNSDNIIAIMKQFAPPEWESIKDDVLAQRVSIQEGVGQMFALLPVELKEDIETERTESELQQVSGFSSNINCFPNSLVVFPHTEDTLKSKLRGAEAADVFGRQ